MINSNYNIIQEFIYTPEDINELIQKDNNNYLDKISYLLMFGSVFLPNNDVKAGNIEKINSSPKIEFVVVNELQLEDYQNNILSLENYNFCFYKNKEDKKVWIEKILSFKSLQESWDGFGAMPLEIKSATNAINFLNILSESQDFNNPTNIFPNPHGTVSLIWENLYSERISLEIGNSSLSYYSLYNRSNPEFFNNVELIDTNIETIARKINSLF